MSEHQPYDDLLRERFSELPLPDENFAWVDMEKRLEKKRRRRIIFWWRPGCGVALLVIALLSTLLFFIDPFLMFKTKIIDNANNENNKSTDTVLKKQPSRGRSELPENYDDKKYPKSAIDSMGNPHISKTIIDQQPENSNISVDKPGHAKKTKHKNKSFDDGNSEMKIKGSAIKKLKEAIDQDSILRSDTNSVVVTTKAPDDKNPVDTIVPKLSDTVRVKMPGAEIKKSDDVPEKNTFFSAGLGLFQQLPVDGQTLTPYGPSGRKGNLSDYIPSIYLRFHKENKWFIQTGFRYGAPQQTKEPIYIQEKFLDTVGIRDFTNTTNYKLKKTFYHQVPLSFHIHVTPYLSVGAGAIWNKFSSAIAEREIIRTHNVTLADSLLARNIVRDKGDSLFLNSYFQLMFETQFKWKRLEVGARYSFGIEPYLKFQIPGGQETLEKNSSLQIFIRYELWRQKRK